MYNIGEKEIELVSTLFDGNPVKIEAFLNLLNLVNYNQVKMPDLQMKLPDEPCIHESKEICLADFPDSIKNCKQPCNFYIGCDTIRKLN